MEVPIVIGFEKEKALAMLGEDAQVVFDMTSTPYPDKKEERRHAIPIVVRQRVEGNTVHLTLSQFK